MPLSARLRFILTLILMKRILFFLLLLILTTGLRAQWEERIYQPSIHSVKLFKAGDIYSYPVLQLNGADQLELHFDDMDGDIKNFYFSFILCNADWTQSSLMGFDYIQGFQSTRIGTYRNSSISETRYTHYQARFPERNSIPSRSGNYILKVFLNNDTSKTVLTKRFLVVDNKVQIGAQIRQPYNGQLFQTHQRVQAVINTANSRINILSPQDIRLRILQNYNWNTSVMVDKPTIFRGNYFEFSDDGTTFPGGIEWRWIDLRSLRLMSDRMVKIYDSVPGRVDVVVKPDVDRKGQVYFFYTDINGIYTLENTDGNNPYWQSDYAYTHFTFVPPNKQAIPGKDIYLYGEVTGYKTNDASRMEFNEEKGVYEKTLFLKQGYYNYSYVAQPGGASRNAAPENIEGNYWGAENNYMVLVYFRPFGGRADELVGFTQLNSVAGTR